jgi:hypothetical protein
MQPTSTLIDLTTTTNTHFMMTTVTPSPSTVTVPATFANDGFDVSQVTMAVYWKNIGELDLYTPTTLQTIADDSIDSRVADLKERGIKVEEIS